MRLQAWRKTAGAAIFGRCSRKVQVVQVLGLVFALAGCAGQVEPEPRTVRVEVPVVVPCRVPAVEVPAWATAGLKKSDDIQTKVRALLAERLQRIGYEAQILAANQACQD
ncbi:TPA: hypothetical protein L4810_006003 [Pseudomonas aeruginosa]|uniref:hypothetical protein n=1 Tax=Pseudomonas aeruginosa TaxID=287 RepID=UPI0009A35E32|nr:hypothetical protein [Pseudomonas aeruginosa]ARI91288.1 hypothetical protein B7W86_13905 [Pseudomonas aeruginosa]ARI97726.1 hypothetical protein B7W87_13910 [Pseudomonas aeruginosa]AXS94677.1 hypothetical protein D0Y57_16980 [Pseudomonas aeruginosa]AXT01912.1 hypothetical protein D0Y55_20960 [Pseudomonas aeruginosa]AXT08515.1 hypothetical protein D0Y58_21695 [Pseudomonas aeruginosa]